MDRPLRVLFRTQLDRWMSPKGLWLLVAAALVPVLLTGSWVVTHQADIAASDLTWSPEQPVLGDTVRFTSTVENVGDEPVDEFNASINVGVLRGNQLNVMERNVTVVDGLDPGESRTIELTWTPRNMGSYWALAQVDEEDVVGEVEELNNQLPRPVTVRAPPVNESNAPTAPGNLTGPADSNDTVDAAVALGEIPEQPLPQRNVTLTATVSNPGDTPVTNATATLRVVRSVDNTARPVPGASTVLRISELAPGETRTLELTWRTSLGTYWVESFVAVDDQRDTGGDNNHATEAIQVQPVAGEEPPELQENTTLRVFYKVLLDLLYLPLLLPLVGLFFAGGVVKDEQREGTLTYLLVRPLPRWLIPATKFSSGFLVSAGAVVAGLVVTFLLIFGYADAPISFLTAPLALSLLSLLVYGALFTLVGVLVDRPYVVGAAVVLGWEAIVGNFVPWVQNATVAYHLRNLVDAWWVADDLVFKSLPAFEDAWRPAAVLLGAAVAFLVLASVAMHRKEFPGE